MENEARSGKRHQGGLQESSMKEQTNISKEEGVLKKNSMENLQAQSKQVSTPSFVCYLVLTLITG